MSIDKLFLGQAEQTVTGFGAGIVAGLQSQGFTAHGWTAQSTDVWLFLEQLGVDGISTNLVVESIDLQAD